jgi:hypothetical protein
MPLQMQIKSESLSSYSFSMISPHANADADADGDADQNRIKSKPPIRASIGLSVEARNRHFGFLSGLNSKEKTKTLENDHH